MSLKNIPSSPSLIAPIAEDGRSEARGSGVAQMKARQACKLREIRDALVAAGVPSLDEQAAMLRLSRSTAWTILHGNHKGSGLSATIISRMLAAPRLLPRVRDKIIEYVEEKAAGLYGHSKTQRRRFIARLSLLLANNKAKKTKECSLRPWSNDVSAEIGRFVKSRQQGKAGRECKAAAAPQSYSRIPRLNNSTRD